MQVNVERIRRYMKDKGLTQVQFASMTGVTQTDISRMLAGQRGAGMAVAGRLLRSMPVEMWPDLLLFDDGQSVFASYDSSKTGGSFRLSA